MRIQTQWLLTGLSVVVMFVSVVGCQTNQRDERRAGWAFDDKYVTADVKNALRSDSADRLDGISVSTFNGEVQLNGFVGTDEQKRRAARIAEGVPGAELVVNSISVEPAKPSLTANWKGPSTLFAEEEAQGGRNWSPHP